MKLFCISLLTSVYAGYLNRSMVISIGAFIHIVNEFDYALSRYIRELSYGIRCSSLAFLNDGQ